MIRFLPSALLLALLLSGGIVHAQGVMTFTAEEHDFGSIAEGEQPEHVFSFTNTGDAPLTLRHVQPSCGCTTPSFTTDPVAPGETGEIVVAYDSQGRPGDFRKSISVEADGAEPASLRLFIVGDVVPTSLTVGDQQGGVMFDADRHSFISLKADEPVNHTFRMQNKTQRPIRITGARSMTEGVEVVYPDRPVFPDEIVEVAVRVPEAGAALNARGHLDVAVILETTDETQPTKSLRLEGTVYFAETTAEPITDTQ